MQKQAPTIGRLLVMVGFALSCFGLLLFLWLAFGGPIPLAPKGYRFQTSFDAATQLAKEADVRISGVSVGKVKEIQTQSDGRTKVTIQLDSKYAPLPKDSHAILRQKTLLGETYVELTPGDKGTGTIPENGTLPKSQVSPTVELDEIFRAFDSKTREAFQNWMQSQAASFHGRGQDINDALGNLGPLAVDADTLLRILNAQESDVRGVVRDTGTVFNALSARDDELASLITNSNRVFSVTAQRDQDLKDLFRVLPTFQRESTTTVNRLTRFANNTNPLVTQLRPAARELSPTLQQLSLLAPDLKGLFHDIPPLETASQAGLPALERFLDEFRPFLGEFDAPLRQLNPILRFIGAYRNELRAFLTNVPAATQAVDRPANAKGPVHYLRTLNPVNPENLAQYPHRIGTNRNNAYELPGGYLQLAQDQRKTYETRACGNGNPTLAPIDPGNPIGSLINGIQQFTFGFAAGQTAGKVAAPPCIQQGKNSAGGAQPGQYPHLLADPSGSAGLAP
jgi:phospholipid/cholesterol/gamma-HCH transport system substrate-binding protein